MVINDLLAQARRAGCSDLHIACGEPPVVRKNGALIRLSDHGAFDEQQIRDIAVSMLEASGIKAGFLEADVDFGYQTPDGERQRVIYFPAARNDGHSHKDAAIRRAHDRAARPAGNIYGDSR
jgi:twitching motility protein PilT